MMKSTHVSKQSSPIHSANTRKQRRRVVLTITLLVSVVTAGYILWSLRPIILPFIIGTFVAYLCFPLLKVFTRMGIPRPASILLLFGTFTVAIMILVNQVGSITPDEKDQLVLRTRFQYKLKERYKGFMELEKPGDTGNMIYKYFGSDIDRQMENLKDFLRLNKDDRKLFMKYRYGYKNVPPIEDKYYDYFLKNSSLTLENNEVNITPQGDDGLRNTGDQEQESRISIVMSAFKLWIIMPLVFLFLLLDDGEIKRFFIGHVNNRYFEVSLVVVDKVNKAIGNYLRGILIECSLVGISYIILLSLIGFEIKIAVMIGLFAGIANAIPLVGPAIAIAAGSTYALIAENVYSILPFITSSNMIVAVMFCVLLVLVLDNAVFQPFVVGGAVQLHPLVVFIGIIGGSMLFGFAGLILAIPAIVVVKELFFTLFRELKEYYII